MKALTILLCSLFLLVACKSEEQKRQEAVIRQEAYLQAQAMAKERAANEESARENADTLKEAQEYMAKIESENKKRIEKLKKSKINQ